MGVGRASLRRAPPRPNCLTYAGSRRAPPPCSRSEDGGARRDGGRLGGGEGWLSPTHVYMSGEAEAGGQGRGWGGAGCMGWVAGLATQRGGASEDGRLAAKRRQRPCPPAQGASSRAKRVASPRARASGRSRQAPQLARARGRRGECGAGSGAAARWVGGWSAAAPRPCPAEPRRVGALCGAGTNPRRARTPPAPRWVGGWSGAGGVGGSRTHGRARPAPRRAVGRCRLGWGAGGGWWVVHGAGHAGVREGHGAFPRDAEPHALAVTKPD